MSLDAYEVLGVPPSADEAAIKRAFRVLARRYHPDVSSDARDHERFKAARRAYEELIDRDARERLDERRRAEPIRPRRDLPPEPGEGVPPTPGRGGRWTSRRKAAKSRGNDDIFDIIGRSMRTFGRGGSAWLYEPLAPHEQRFEGRLTGSRRFELDAVLTRAEARAGIAIPFRFQLGPREVAENVKVPPGVQSGDTLEYSIPVAEDIDLELLVHVEVA